MDYKNIAFIMARSGSRGIPGKNTKLLCGTHLVGYTIDAAMGCDKIDLVVFTSDDDEIIKIASQYARIYDPEGERWMVIKRPDYLAQDHVQVEEVVLHAVRELEVRDIRGEAAIILQPTSPLRTYTHIYEALELWDRRSMLFSAHPAPYGYLWEWNYANGAIEPLGHIPEKRLGRQWDFHGTGIVKENGAIYIIPFSKLSLYGRIRLAPFSIYLMDEQDSIDLDTMDDWVAAENELKKRGYQFAHPVQKEE